MPCARAREVLMQDAIYLVPGTRYREHPYHMLLLAVCIPKELRSSY